MATMKLIIDGAKIEVTPSVNIAMYDYLEESGLYKLMEDGKATYPIHLPNGFFVSGVEIT